MVGLFQLRVLKQVNAALQVPNFIVDESSAVRGDYLQSDLHFHVYIFCDIEINAAKGNAPVVWRS